MTFLEDTSNPSVESWQAVTYALHQKHNVGRVRVIRAGSTGTVLIDFNHGDSALLLSTTETFVRGARMIKEGTAPIHEHDGQRFFTINPGD